MNRCNLIKRGDWFCYLTQIEHRGWSHWKAHRKWFIQRHQATASNGTLKVLDYNFTQWNINDEFYVNEIIQWTRYVSFREDFKMCIVWSLLWTYSLVDSGHSVDSILRDYNEQNSHFGKCSSLMSRWSRNPGTMQHNFNWMNIRIWCHYSSTDIYLTVTRVAGRAGVRNHLTVREKLAIMFTTI